jgi:hypothetical protein
MEGCSCSGSMVQTITSYQEKYHFNTSRLHPYRVGCSRLFVSHTIRIIAELSSVSINSTSRLQQLEVQVTTQKREMARLHARYESMITAHSFIHFINCDRCIVMCSGPVSKCDHGTTAASLGSINCHCISVGFVLI